MADQPPWRPATMMHTPEESLTPLNAADCPAYILAGGLSSRFGSNKARVEVTSMGLAPEPLLLALRRRLSQHGHAVEIVADRADRYDDLGVRCLVDQRPGQGPLAGVATALHHRYQQQPGWLLLVSCDLLVWRTEWFEKLANAIGAPTERRSAPAPQTVLNAIAFASRSPDERPRWEPFPSLLHSRLLPQAVSRLQCGQRSLQSFLRASQTVGVPTHENPQWWTFNTTEQLHSLRHLQTLPKGACGDSQ